MMLYGQSICVVRRISISVYIATYQYVAIYGPPFYVLSNAYVNTFDKKRQLDNTIITKNNSKYVQNRLARKRQLDSTIITKNNLKYVQNTTKKDSR